MTINKFQGKTKEEAIEKAKEAFGPGAVIMNVKEVKPKGLFRSFKNSTYEVTAAMEEKEVYSPTQNTISVPQRKDNINLIFTKEDGLYTGTDITRYPYKIIHHEMGIKKCRFWRNL